jgi:hypothetical protein
LRAGLRWYQRTEHDCENRCGEILHTGQLPWLKVS